MITLIFREAAKSTMKHWTSDWKTKQAALKDARGNALRVIAILTEEEVKHESNKDFFDTLNYDKKKCDAYEYCRQILSNNLMRKEFLIEEIEEEMKNFEEIVKKFESIKKLTWEEYCFIKFGKYDIDEDMMYKLYGKDECAATISDFDEDYEKSNGCTDEELKDRKAYRGAVALIDNEMDCLADINQGKDDFKFYIDDAHDRIERRLTAAKSSTI